MGKLLRIMCASYVGLVSFVILNLVWGPSGMTATQQVRDFKSLLTENVGALEKIGANLEKELAQLETDEERILVEARRLGYFRSDEKKIYVPGYESQAEAVRLGTQVFRNAAPRDLTGLFRIFSLTLAAFTALLLLWPYEKSRAHSGRRPVRRHINRPNAA